MRADRLIALMLLLQHRGRLTAQALADELEVSKRTIYRDVEALCAAGIPVTTELGPGGGFELPSTYRTSLTALTEIELRTLFVAGAPRLLADLGLAGTLATALRKVAASVPGTQRHAAEHVGRRVYVDPSAWFHAAEAVPFLATAQDAVWRARKLILSYRKANGVNADLDLDLARFW